MEENALSETIIKSINKTFVLWTKKNKNVNILQIVQQLNLTSVALRKMASKLEEEYKNSIHKGNQ